MRAQAAVEVICDRKINYAYDVKIKNQIKKKMSHFKIKPLQYFVNKNILHNLSENSYYNYIRRLFTAD